MKENLRALRLSVARCELEKRLKERTWRLGLLRSIGIPEGDWAARLFNLDVYIDELRESLER